MGLFDFFKTTKKAKTNKSSKNYHENGQLEKEENFDELMTNSEERDLLHSLIEDHKELEETTETTSKIISSLESYIDFDIIIKFREENFVINEALNNLNGEIKKVFLSIYEIIDLGKDDCIFLEDVQLHLLDIIDVDKTKTLLLELEVMEIIKMPSSYSYQILPDYDRSDWSEHSPNQLTSNLSKDQEKLREGIKESVFRNKHGFFKKNKKTFFESIKDKIIVDQKIDSNIKIVDNSEVTFSTINSVTIRVSKEGNLPFNGIVFGLFSDYIEKELNGKLWNISTYKNGIQDGLKIFWRKNGEIKKITDYKEGVEIERKEFDEEGNLLKNNESICYVERDKLIKSNLRQFASFEVKDLEWVVKDMSTNTIVFTSDSYSECEQWMK